MIAGPLEWAAFWLVVGVAFVVDAALASRGEREPTVRSAALWSAVWIGLALLFGVGLALRFGLDVGLTYLTAYALEKSLSVDNLFLFILIFAQTGIPARLQHRALFWGIAGALLMRALLIGLRSLYFLLSGSMARLRFLRPGLAVVLLFVAAKMLLGQSLEVPPAVSLLVIGCIFGAAIVASKLFPDRTMPRASVECSHADQIGDVTPSSQGCEQCLKLGDRWVHLRMCLVCGQVGCCDSSKNKHATRHFHATGHPVMRSIEPGEDWRWCFVDQVMLEPPRSPTA